MKTRIHLSLNNSLLAKANVLMQEADYGSLTEYLEQLIRKEWDRQTTPQTRYSCLLQQLAAAALDARKSPSPAVQPQTAEAL